MTLEILDPHVNVRVLLFRPFAACTQSGSQCRPSIFSNLFFSQDRQRYIQLRPNTSYVIRAVFYHFTPSTSGNGKSMREENDSSANNFNNVWNYHLPFDVGYVSLCYHH